MIRWLYLCAAFSVSLSAFAQRPLDDREVSAALLRATRFMTGRIAVHGGYAWTSSADGRYSNGEGVAGPQRVWVQPPGTPAVGLSFLRVYEVTKDPIALGAAKDAAHALIRGQNDLGGWQHTIRFNHPKSNYVSFDDDQTQTAIRILMALDQQIDNDSLTYAIEKSLNMMLAAQLENGGWQHQYPKRCNYHDYATFNDEGINDCIRVMMDAYEYYRKDEYK